MSRCSGSGGGHGKQHLTGWTGHVMMDMGSHGESHHHVLGVFVSIGYKQTGHHHHHHHPLALLPETASTSASPATHWQRAFFLGSTDY